MFTSIYSLVFDYLSLFTVSIVPYSFTPYVSTFNTVITPFYSGAQHLHICAFINMISISFFKLNSLFPYFHNYFI